MFELSLDIFLCHIITNIETTLAGTCITFSPDVLAGIIGTILSVWLYYNFCNWLNVLNWGISSINGMVVAVVCYLIGYFVKKNQR